MSRHAADETSVEKTDPWEWVNNVDPLEITVANMLEVYNLNTEKFPREMPTGQGGSVVRNPFWIKRIGEKKWQNMPKDELITEDHSDYAKEILKIRNEEFAGLSNCGATCYVNSIFQVWFHNPLLREPILNWTPPENRDDSVCLLVELQKLFARMRFSKLASISTEDLIRSLNLNENSQQDAQEFALLFTEKLIRTLDRYEEKTMKTLFDTLFTGEAQYETKCSSCNNISVRKEDFTELKVGLANSLNIALDALLEEELFSGGNQYACSACQKQVDAIRTMTITKFPTICQIQIQRYVFNRKTLRNEKKTDDFNYPNKIDLTRWGAPQVTENGSYSLQAVLKHVGSSTERGHYYVMVRHALSGQWHKISDEHVKVDDCDEVSNRDQCSSLSTLRIEEEETPKSYSSGEVCMLIYINDRDQKKMQEIEDSEQVKNHRARIEKEDQDHIAAATAAQIQKILRHSLITDLFSSLSLETRSQSEVLDEHFISFDWLKEFVKNDSNCKTKPIDNRPLILCPHNKVRPLLKASDQASVPYRVIPKAVAERLYLEYSGGPALQVKDSMCLTCIQIRCKQLRSYGKIKSDFETAKKKQQEFDKLYLTYKNDKTYPDNFFEDKRWIHNNFFKNWKMHANKAIEEMTDINFKKDITQECKKDLICDKEMLKCSEENRILIPQEVWSLLMENYFVINYDFTANTLKPCPGCEKSRENNVPVWDQNKALYGILKEKIPNLLSGKNRPVPGQVGNFFLVPQTFVDRLRYFMESPTERNPPGCVENIQLQCSHGKVQYPVFRYEMDNRIDHLLMAQVDGRLAVLREPEWDSLKSIISYDLEIKVTIDPDQTIRQEDIFCQECGATWWEEAFKKQQDFVEKDIVIKFMLHSRGPGQAKQPKTEHLIKVSGDFHIFQLKAVIFNKFKVPPKNQRLTLHDIELEDGDRNNLIMDYRILPGATLNLERIPDPVVEISPNELIETLRN